MNLFDYSDEELLAFAKEKSQGLAAAVDGAAAAAGILHVLQRFTISDLQIIGANIRYEVEKLPEPYRSRYRPYASDLLDKYHECIAAAKAGTRFEIIDEELWKSYWYSAAEHLSEDTEDFTDELPRPCTSRLAGKFFYRLVYGYVMLLAGKPGHPVGTPFPGGWKVLEEKGVILCPIRDKEKDLPLALCNFCPAVQDERCR
ncbi:MAG: DUF2115 domain-containing protein [Methanocorpusculum sp.]|nr:DUF2115 domain-containing protein [Methanocorpusculum sp.]